MTDDQDDDELNMQVLLPHIISSRFRGCVEAIDEDFAAGLSDMAAARPHWLMPLRMKSVFPFTRFLLLNCRCGVSVSNHFGFCLRCCSHC